MTMGSLFGSAYAEQDYASQNPGDIPYDPYAYLEPEEDPYAPLNPNRGGFRDPVYNPANVAPGGQYAPNPDYGIMDIGRASEATRIPYYSDFAQQYLVPAVNAAADPLGIQSWVQGQTLGTDIGAGDVIVPITGLDIALNAATGGGLTGFDDIARMGARGLSAADNIYRAGMPEPQLYPGLSGGLPPPGAIPDPFGNPPIEAFNDPIERAIVNQTYIWRISASKRAASFSTPVGMRPCIGAASPPIAPCPE